MEEKNILLVLVIYGCTVEQSTTYKTLIATNAEAVRNMFIYDNSPIEQTTSLNVAKYVCDTSNGGLSKAYNEAYKFAISNGYQWLLLLDQDTHFPKNALECYKKAAIDNMAQMIVPRHKVAGDLYMSPTPYRWKSSDLKAQTPTGLVNFSTCSPINSGIMVTVESFMKAGGYDEKVWLDFSDVCFIEKYKRHYTSFYVMPEVTCLQEFSGLDTDPKKVYKRFCIYLECARNYSKTHLADKLAMLITTLRPTLSRTIKECTSKYLNAYWNIYIRDNKK